MNQSSLVSYQGQIIPEAEFRIGPQNRSFRYGDGLFETIRISKGKALFFPLHYSRLILGMDIMGYQIPEEWSIRTLQDWAEDLARESRIENGRMRIDVWRAGAGLYTPDSLSPEILFGLTPLDNPWYSWPAKGLSVDVAERVQVGTEPWERLKRTSAGHYVLAGIERKQRGLDDLLLLNRQGRLAEATSSNLFLWLDKQLLTPPEEEGGVSGVMARVLYKIARREGIKVNRRALNVEDLERADEAFLSNVIAGIRWISDFRGKRFENDFAFGLFGKLEEKVLREISR